MLTSNPQNLLIDADDTLWESNIFFERVIAEVQAILLQSYGVDPAEFREHLNDLERAHTPIYGFGTVNFTRSLVEAFEHFAGGNSGAADRVRHLAMGILEHPVELLDGVPETLGYLAARHRLFLVTKGETVEQLRKVEASGLRAHFDEVEVLAHKNEQVYRQLVEAHRWNPADTWMIGNSVRSDINPALAAGLSAVYVPHPHTWILEHDDPLQHSRLLSVSSFRELQLHF